VNEPGHLGVSEKKLIMAEKGTYVNIVGLFIYMYIFTFEIKSIIITNDCLCGLVVRVSGYSYRGPGFDPRRYQIF